MPRKPTAKRVWMADGSMRVVNKAGNGDGSVFHVPERRTTLTDGRTRIRRAHWRATYRDPVSGQQRAVQAATRDGATGRRDDAIAEALERRPHSTRLDRTSTLSELADWWIYTHGARVRPSSLTKYRDRLDRLGPLADLAVGDVTAERVADWQSWLLNTARPSGRTLSPKTVADTRATLRQLFAAAVDLDVIARNPVDRVKPPKIERPPGRVLTADDVGLLVKETDRYRYGAVVAILFTVGLRVSEVLGLAWSDVDLNAGTAHVRRALVDGPGARQLGPTKTRGATGVHHLAPGTIQRLRAWRAQQAEERLIAGTLWQSQTYNGTPLELVFTQPDGRPVARQQIDKLLRRAAQRVGLDSTRLGTHVGRRTVVTTLYTAGTDIGDIARHVGHASPATTSTYVASLGDRPAKTARLAAKLLDSPMAHSS